MITSTSSSQVKHVMQLLKKAKTRKEFKEFVVEGARMVKEAPLERLVKMYASQSFYENHKDFFGDILADRLEIVSDSVFCQMSDTQTPQGVLAVVKMHSAEWSDIFSDNPLILMIENLQDPGNLGTIVRMGEGAGVSGVIMSSNTVDIYNPKTIRSTMGSIYRVPFIYTDDFTGTIKKCQREGVTIYAAHLDGRNTYTQENYKKPTAFLIGNEGNGLSCKATEAADTLIKIPMEGQVESLNAAIACTVLTYEAMRQRKN
ncbi:MAG: RNA methyltransferase [Eubacteriales bacterium]|nr:RNA methyltransferase [Eubacteriales bacterium]